MTRRESRSPSNSDSPIGAPEGTAVAKHPATYVVVVTSGAELSEHTPAWEQLVAVAAEPNVFYEPWMLLPALERFDRDRDLVFVLVYAPDPARSSAPPLLCGFFPLVREIRSVGLSVSVLTLWKHLYCFLCTPLVRTGYVGPCVDAFFDWAASDASKADIVELRTIAGEGPIRRALTDHFRARRTVTVSRDSYTRAFLRIQGDETAYLPARLSGKRRNDLKRKERKLSEIGELKYLGLETKSDLDVWIEQFLACEARGWKGQAGDALACSARDRDYFIKIAQEAFRMGRLQLLALHLNGRPIAMRCSFLAPPGSFFFKPAFDEEYARFSPGVLLELETLRRLRGQTGIRWMDSCTAPDNALLNDLWLDRILVDTIWAATGRGNGELVVSLLPLGRWLRARIRGRGPG